MNVIIFFNGWGMEKDIVSHIKIPENYDFILLSFPYKFDINTLNKYEKIFFIGFSFGVSYMAEFISDNKNILKNKNFQVISVNGFPFFTEKNFLNRKVILLTLKNLNENNLKLFYEKAGIKNFVFHKSIPQLKEELRYFLNKKFYIKNQIIHKAFISSDDKIIKTELQKNFYETNHIPCVFIEGEHCIFHKIKEWRYFFNYEF